MAKRHYPQFSRDVEMYILVSYMGVQTATTPTREPKRVHNIKLRVFQFENENGVWIYGNTRAFADHLIEKFRLPYSVVLMPEYINAVLRSHGFFVRRVTGLEPGAKHGAPQEARTAESELALVEATQDAFAA